MATRTIEILPARRARLTGAASRLIGPSLFRDRLSWTIAGIAALVGLVFLMVDLFYGHGNLYAPLDDVYIHLQYGREIGSGHFFKIDPGDPVSTGASSTLYALLLGFAYLVGFHGNALLWFAMVTGVLFWAVSTALICQLGTLLVSRSVGIWTAVLVALSGGLAWTASSGMEVGLVMLLITATLLALARETPTRRYVVTPVLAALLALARPEGAIFALALCGGQLWTLWDGRDELGRRRTLKFAAWSLLPLVAFTAQLLFYWLATGTTSATGLQVKSMLYDQPVFYLWTFIDGVVANLRGFVSLYSGFTNQSYMFPGASLIFVVGLGYLLTQRPRWRPIWIAAAVGMAGVLLSVSTLVDPAGAGSRYVAPFVPIYILVIVSGFYALSKLAADRALRRRVMYVGVAVPLAFALLVLPSWAMWFGQNSDTIGTMDVRLALWVKQNVPRNAIVAVKDLGAISYYSDHRVVDLIGLGTEGLGIPDDQGPGALYEALAHMPASRRPTYFAAYDSVPGVSMIPFEDIGLLRSPPLARLPGRLPPLGDDGSIVPFAELDVYRADWSDPPLGTAPSVPGKLRDHVTIGYLPSEKAHGYSPQMAEDGIEPMTIVSRVGNATEAGRQIVGGELFTAHNLSGRKPLTVTAHIGVNPGSAPRLQVLADGRVVGSLDLRQGPRVPWSTYRFTIPARFVQGTSLTLELRDPPPPRRGSYELNPYPDYNSYGYWFSQP